MLSMWATNILIGMQNTCLSLFKSDVEEIEIRVNELDKGVERQIKIIVKLNKPQEGDDESARSSD